MVSLFYWCFLVSSWIRQYLDTTYTTPSHQWQPSNPWLAYGVQQPMNNKVTWCHQVYKQDNRWMSYYGHALTPGFPTQMDINSRRVVYGVYGTELHHDVPSSAYHSLGTGQKQCQATKDKNHEVGTDKVQKIGRLH